MNSVCQEVNRVFNEMKKRGLPIVKISGDISQLTLQFLPCDAQRVEKVLAIHSPGDNAKILATAQEYCDRFQHTIASRDSASQEFYEYLLTSPIFFDTNRPIYKEVELRHYCQTQTRVDLVDLATNSIAQIHVTCPNPFTDARKKAKKNQILRTAEEFFKKHYNLDMRLFRIDGTQRTSYWDVSVYQLGTRACYSNLTEMLAKR